MIPLGQPGPMTDMERYVFETWGYLVIPDALTPQETEDCLAAAKRLYATLPQDEFRQLGNTFEQEPAFENLVDHPSILPKARALFGPGTKVAVIPPPLASSAGRCRTRSTLSKKGTRSWPPVTESPA